MFGRSKPPLKKIVPPNGEEYVSDEQLKSELNELKLQALMKKVAEQEIIIRRLLELVVMNIEHKRYDQMRPKIAAISNMLDKK